MSSLGVRLKKAREEKRLTQMEAATKVGISNGTLSGYERNYRDPDTDTLRKLADLYGVTTDWLLHGVNHKKAHDKFNSVEGVSEQNESYTSTSEIIRLIEEEARRIGLSPSDPVFKEILTDAFELLRVARGKDNQ